jgi:hypothetical protein
MADDYAEVEDRLRQRSASLQAIGMQFTEVDHREMATVLAALDLAAKVEGVLREMKQIGKNLSQESQREYTDAVADGFNSAVSMFSGAFKLNLDLTEPEGKES